MVHNKHKIVTRPIFHIFWRGFHDVAMQLPWCSLQQAAQIEVEIMFNDTPEPANQCIQDYLNHSQVGSEVCRPLELELG